MPTPSPTPRDVVPDGDLKQTPSPDARATDSAGTIPTAPAPSIHPAVNLEILPGYRLTRMLGSGGFGEVWEASAPGGYRIALKFLRLDQWAGQVEMKHLEHLKDIRHAHLLSVTGAWERSGYLVLAMELADGTVSDRLQECQSVGLPGIPEDELLELMRDAARGIDYLNEKGIIHRDVKPANLMMVGGTVKVADFGLAKLIDQTIASKSSGFSIAYAAPELFTNTLSKSVDQYALAVSYCELRGGNLPFSGTPHQIMFAHAAAEPDLSMLPEHERPAVMRALAKTPSQRWPSCREFVEALSGKAARSDWPEAKAPPAGGPLQSTPLPVPAPKVTPIAGSPPRRRRALLFGAPLLIGVAVGLALLLRNPTPKLDAPKSAAPSHQLVDANPKLPEEKPPIGTVRLLPFPELAPLTAGESASFTIVIERENLPGDVDLALIDPPKGVELQPRLIPAGQTQVTARLITSRDTPHGMNRLILAALVGQVKDELQLRLTVRSAVMPKLVVKLPANAILTTGQETNLDATIEREHWTGDVTLEWSDLPAGVQSVGSTTLPANRDRSTLVLAADWSARSDGTARLRARGTGITAADAIIELRIQREEPPKLDSTKNAVDAATVKKIQQNWAAYLGEPVVETIDLGDGVKMEFVLVPPGEFWMGSPDEDKDAENDEKPRHKVRIGKPFYLARTPVTKGQFAAFISATGKKSEAEEDGNGGWGYNSEKNEFEGRDPRYTWKNTGWPQTDGHPVVNVTHNDAVKFCQWLKTRKSSVQPQLPSEAEWEFACRAGTTARYFTGDQPRSLDDFANVADASLKRKNIKETATWTFFDFDDGYPFTSPVGRFKPNALDLRDMTGNVWQWCADSYSAKAHANPSANEVGWLDQDQLDNRVVRGASWISAPRLARSAYRVRSDPGNRSYYVGFRISLRLSAPRPSIQ